MLPVTGAIVLLLLAVVVVLQIRSAAGIRRAAVWGGLGILGIGSAGGVLAMEPAF